MSEINITNKFYGGMAGDDYLGAKESFLFSENLDYRQNYNSIELVRGLQVNGTTGTDDMTGFTEVFSGSSLPKIFAWGENGKFYNTTGLYLGQTTNAKDIANAIPYRDYIYFIYDNGTSAAMDRITKADAFNNINVSLGFNGRVSSNVITGITQDSDSGKYPMLNYVDEFLLIGVGNKLYKLSGDNTVVSNLFSNELEADIVGITEYSGLFKIYLQSGKILFWDGQSETFSAITDIKNTISNVYGYGNTDYIIAGYNTFYSELHILRGYQTQLLQRVIYSEREGKYLYAFGDTTNSSKPQIMCKRLGLLWIGSNRAVTEGIYTYGTDLLGTNDAFQLNYTKDKDGETITSVNALYPTTAGMYIAYGTSTGGKIGLVDLNVQTSGGNYQQSGNIITQVFDGGYRTQTKQLKKIKVRTANTTSSNYINIYFKRDGGSWEFVGVCNESNRDKYELIKPLGEFNDMQVKAEFIGTGTSTPKLLEVAVVYDIIND